MAEGTLRWWLLRDGRPLAAPGIRAARRRRGAACLDDACAGAVPARPSDRRRTSRRRLADRPVPARTSPTHLGSGAELQRLYVVHSGCWSPPTPPGRSASATASCGPSWSPPHPGGAPVRGRAPRLRRRPQRGHGRRRGVRPAEQHRGERALAAVPRAQQLHRPRCHVQRRPRGRSPAQPQPGRDDRPGRVLVPGDLHGGRVSPGRGDASDVRRRHLGRRRARRVVHGQCDSPTTRSGPTLSTPSTRSTHDQFVDSYAATHPVEDFAESFAMWCALGPSSPLLPDFIEGDPTDGAAKLAWFDDPAEPWGYRRAHGARQLRALTR